VFDEIVSCVEFRAVKGNANFKKNQTIHGRFCLTMKDTVQLTKIMISHVITQSVIQSWKEA